MIPALIGAVIIGVSLGLFGSGGSILTVPALLYLLGHEPRVAIAESLGIVGAIALVSAIPYARRGQVRWSTAFLFGLPGMVGTYGGAWLGGLVPGVAQVLTFAGVMLVAAVLMWRGTDAGSGEPTSRPRSTAKIIVDGLAVGLLTGFVGVGGGFLIVPALVLLGGLSMRTAIATSLVIIAMKSATGFWKYLDILADTGRAIDWSTLGIFIGIGALGSIAGRRLGDRLDTHHLQRGFAVFLVVMALFIGVQESTGIGRAPPDPGVTTSATAAR